MRLRPTWGARRPVGPLSRWWRYGFPAALVVLASLTLALGLHGSRLVLESRDGTLVSTERDPTQPGYVAMVEPTPTLLVVHHGPAGELVNALVAALGAHGAGGWLVSFPTDLVVSTPEGPQLLSELHATHGVDAPGGVRGALASVLGVGIDGTVVVDAPTLAELVAPVAPLRVVLTDDVRAERDGELVTLLGRGPAAIASAEDIWAATEVIGPGEAPVARQVRQLDFWRAWIDALTAGGDVGRDAPGAATLGPFLVGLASGVANVEPAPVTVTDFEGFPLSVPDADAIAALVVDMVPFPVGAEPGDRVVVDLRNGTGDFTQTPVAARQLVAAGAQVAIVGNARSFAVARSVVAYHDPADRARAEVLAEALGGAEVVLDERPESAVDVTVTIGADYRPADAAG